MTDYKTLCAELVKAHDAVESMSVSEWTSNLTAAISRARAALAEGAGVGPTLEDVEDLCEEHEFGVEGYESVECLQGLINDAIARYGTSHPRPIPVAERLPTDADCDAEGQCWWWDSIAQVWTYLNRKQAERAGYYTYTYPAAAIPLPEGKSWPS